MNSHIHLHTLWKINPGFCRRAASIKIFPSNLKFFLQPSIPGDYGYNRDRQTHGQIGERIKLVLGYDMKYLTCVKKVTDSLVISISIAQIKVNLIKEKIFKMKNEMT